jgi:hypothetical protein
MGDPARSYQRRDVFGQVVGEGFQRRRHDMADDADVPRSALEGLPASLYDPRLAAL